MEEPEQRNSWREEEHPLLTDPQVQSVCAREIYTKYTSGNTLHSLGEHFSVNLSLFTRLTRLVKNETSYSCLISAKDEDALFSSIQFNS